MSLKEACEAAGIRSFAEQQTLKQHGHLGPKRVDRIPSELIQADLDLKGGSQLHPRVVLETLLVRLSAPRRD